MNIAFRIADRLHTAGLEFYRFRHESAWAYRIVLATAFAGLTGISAQFRIPLPFTPVPITAQVFVVLLAGGLLGRTLGPLSQAIYVVAGAAGVPWFAPLATAGPFTRGGWAVISGVTGGYLLSYPFAALLVGFVMDRYVRYRSFAPILLTLLGGVLLIYGLGAVQLAMVMGVGPGDAMLYAVVPFVPGDVLKAVIAALVLSGVAPRVAFNGEVDAGERQALALSWGDLALILALLGSVWVLVPVIHVSYPATIELVRWKLSFARDAVVIYYAAAATAATTSILAALGLRSWLRLAGAKLGWMR
jgi:biotin transport system substrate-specific component